jgi:hypothetical protein
MSTYDGAYSERKYPSSQPYWVYPCTCRDEYEEKNEIDPTCDRCNKRD